MIPTMIPNKRPSRESAGLLPFIGDIGITLFGIATVSQLNNFRDHANKLAARVNIMSNTISHQFGEMSSLACHVHEHTVLFNELVSNTSQFRLNIVNALKTSSDQHYTTEKNILQFNNDMMKIRSQVDKLAIGIEALSNKKLSVHMIDPDIMSRTIVGIIAKLKEQFPTYKLVSN